MRIAVLGLGRMGWHLAAHLSDSDAVDELAVFDVVDGLATWLDNWIAKGWKRPKNQPVKNEDLWRALDEFRQKHDIRTHWVKGHDDHPENERCDALAVRGRDEAAIGS